MKWTCKRNQRGAVRVVRRFAWYPICLKDTEKETEWLWLSVFYERQTWGVRPGCDAILDWVVVERWL